MSQAVTLTLSDGGTSTVYFEGEDPPEELQEAVEAALQNTVGLGLDGKRLHWSEAEGNAEWTLTFADGLPEEYTTDADGAAAALPPHRVSEMFTGEDGSGEGLKDTLPSEWRCEPANLEQYEFYPN